VSGKLLQELNLLAACTIYENRITIILVPVESKWADEQLKLTFFCCNTDCCAFFFSLKPSRTQNQTEKLRVVTAIISVLILNHLVS
jgi:hypothetical protein